MEYFEINMVDYKEDKMATFTTKGNLTTCNINGKTVKCITNEYDIPVIISSPSVLIYSDKGLVIHNK